MPTLRRMTEDEFEQYIPGLIEGYAVERARNLRTPPEEELEISRRIIDGLLPDGLNTPGHSLYVLAAEDGETLGYLWVAVEEERQVCSIYDIEIRAAQRGKGYGRLALELLESNLRPLGVKRIALNVFADNEVAKHLYESVGFSATNHAMHKWLS